MQTYIPQCVNGENIEGQTSKNLIVKKHYMLNGISFLNC